MQPSDHLFVVIPGIGGSILERRRGERREVLWEGLGQLSSAVFRPSRLALGDDDEIIATGLLADWRYVGWTAVDGYRHLVARVAAFAGTSVVDWGDPAARTLDARVVCFPFDFRRSIMVAAEQLKSDIQQRLTALGWPPDPSGDPDRRRVVVVAHSMGGLVARYWAGPLRGHEYCHSIITLGTPHRGAPKAIDVLANGWHIGPIPIPGPLKGIMREWPGLHELVPRYRAIRSGGTWSYPKDVELMGADPALTRKAFEVHRSIQDAWKPLGDRAPGLIPVVGVGNTTLESAEHGPGSQVKVGGTLPEWIAEHDSSLATFLGDGTVPRISAIPIDLDQPSFRGLQRHVIGVKHGSLMNWTGLEAELEVALSGSSTAFVEGDSDRRIVIDLPEVWPEGEEITGVVRLYEPTISTELGLEPVEVPVAVQYRWDGNKWNDATRTGTGDWTVTIPGMSAGRATVEARAATDSGDDPDNASADIMVIAIRQIEEMGE